MKVNWCFMMALILAGCGPQGRLAMPEQNVAEKFTVWEEGRSGWNWTMPGGPAILTLSAEGPHEMVWSVREKAMGRVRRSRIGSLQRAPRFFSQGPEGVREIRFSPSGKTILAHEVSVDGGRFQTVLFQMDDYTGGWRSRYLDLGQAAETRARKLDDGSWVPGLLGVPVAPKILRLDESVVIYEIAGETRSLEL